MSENNTIPDEPAPTGYIDVSEGVLWGDDGDGPEKDVLIREWLLTDDPLSSVENRIAYCATIGRYDVADELAAQLASPRRVEVVRETLFRHELV